MPRLPLVHAFRATLVDDTFGVAHNHMVRPHTHGLYEFHAGDCRSAGPVYHKLGIPKRTTGQVARVDQAGRRDNSRAMLVVMKDRYIHQLAQTLLDDETFRRLDVLEVDSAEARPKKPDGVDKFF